MRLIRLADRLNIISELTHVGAYDFNFELYFECRHPIYLEDGAVCVLRKGALADYAAIVAEHQELGLKLVNSVDQHLRSSELSVWYPLISDLTPRSACYKQFPSADEIESDFGWPVFIKGSRQTSKHNPDLCIARDREGYDRLRHAYALDPILHWQDIAVRELVSLKPLPGKVPGKVPASVEFRSFWWEGGCVGWGPYWYQLPAYTEPDIDQGLALAQEAARRLEVPFLVVDFAKKADGSWTIIECNDAQEAGYAGVVPRRLWEAVLNLLA